MLNQIWLIGINENEFEKIFCSYDGKRYGWLYYDNGMLLEAHETENDEGQYMKLVAQTYNSFSMSKNFICEVYYEDSSIVERELEEFDQFILEHME